MSEELSAIVKSMLGEFRKTMAVETVVGKSIEIEDKVLIPIFGMGIGAGGGGGKGAGGKEREGQGYGVGGGGGMVPLVLIAVFKGISGPDGLKVLSLRPPGALGKLVEEALPMMMEKGKEMMESKKTE